MDYLTEVPEGRAWIRKSGVYSQAPLFRRGELLFVKVGSGYVRLQAGGASSVPKLAWLELDAGPDYDIEGGDKSAPSLKDRAKRLKEVA